MVQVVWEFRVQSDKQAEFEKHYSGWGSWAELFRKAAGYRGTALLKDMENGGRYLTIDTWEDMASFRAFQADFKGEYAALDEQCENLTQQESRVGIFETP